MCKSKRRKKRKAKRSHTLTVVALISFIGAAFAIFTGAVYGFLAVIGFGEGYSAIAGGVNLPIMFISGSTWGRSWKIGAEENQFLW